MVSTSMISKWTRAALVGSGIAVAAPAFGQSATPPTANPVTHAVGANPEVNGQAVMETGAGLSSDAKSTPATGAYNPKAVAKGGTPKAAGAK